MIRGTLIANAWMTGNRATNLLEQIAQVTNGLCFLLHGTRRPDSGVAGLHDPGVLPSFSRIPSSFALVQSQYSESQEAAGREWKS